MSKFTDQLWRDLVRDHGSSLARSAAPQRERAGSSRVPRPRLLAGSTLGLIAVAAALLLTLGGSTAPPAFAITTNGDGSVLVKMSYAQNLSLPQVNAKLASMGTGEQITIYMKPGAAPVPGPVTCSRATGTSSPSGPQVQVLNGPNGTDVIRAGESAGNTAEGTYHLDHCVVSRATDSGSGGHAGNSGS